MYSVPPAVTAVMVKRRMYEPPVMPVAMMFWGLPVQPARF